MKLLSVVLTFALLFGANWLSVRLKRAGVAPVSNPAGHATIHREIPGVQPALPFHTFSRQH